MTFKEFLIALLVFSVLGFSTGYAFGPSIMRKEVKRQQVACLNMMHAQYKVHCAQDVQ